MLLSTHSGRVKRAFVFVLPLNRHGPECQQITFSKSVDGKGSCNSFNKYFARLICVGSHSVCTRYCNNIDIAAEKIFLWWNRSKVSDLGGQGGKRSSMKLIRDGLKLIPPWLGLRYHQPKMLSPGVSWWWMAGVAYWRLLWRIDTEPLRVKSPADQTGLDILHLKII